MAEPEQKEQKNGIEHPDEINEDSLDEKLAQGKELYSRGSRNYLLKNYESAADELSQVCGVYEEIYGPSCDELGMPYLLYAKSLIALSLEENKVLDVPDVQDDDESEEEEDNGENKKNEKQPVADENKINGNTEDKSSSENTLGEGTKNNVDEDTKTEVKKTNGEQKGEETKVTSSSSSVKVQDLSGPSSSSAAGSSSAGVEAEKVGENTDNPENEDEENDAATNLQIAWETLELAAKIFSKQGMGGLPNLAEVQTELGNIEFENDILDGAREDYEKALKIYQELPIKTYRRAQAEINYKIGLTYLLQQFNRQGSDAFKIACDLLNDEINDIKNKEDLTEKEKNNIKDMEETQQEILAKIAEIEETRQQCLDEVRAALDKYKSPSKKAPEIAPTSSSSSEVTTSKPTDITHLIKRKKPDTTSPSEDNEPSPAKRLNADD